MMRCELKARRFCEAKHMVNHDDNTFALHVAMEGVRNLLYDCTVGKMRYMMLKEEKKSTNIFLTMCTT